MPFALNFVCGKVLSEYTYYLGFHFILTFCKFSLCNIVKKNYFINIIKLVRIATNEKLSSECVKFLPIGMKTSYLALSYCSQRGGEGPAGPSAR